MSGRKITDRYRVQQIDAGGTVVHLAWWDNIDEAIDHARDYRREFGGEVQVVQVQTAVTERLLRAWGA